MKLTFVLTIASLALLTPQIVNAAELPSRQTQAAPAAKKCQINGQDGVIVPGSQTCVRLSGYVNAQAAFGTVGGARKVSAP